jgi:cytochrome P450
MNCPHSYVLIKGHETSSTNMSWVMLRLANHLDVQKKVQEELDSIFGSDKTRTITQNDVRKMDYLEMVIKETLRINPCIPTIFRLLKDECQLGI